MKTPIKSYQSYVLFEDMPTVQQRGKYVCHVAFEGSGDEMFLLVNVEQGRPSTTKTAELRLRLRYNPVPRRAEAFLEPAEGDGEDEDMEEAA